MSNITHEVMSSDIFQRRVKELQITNTPESPLYEMLLNAYMNYVISMLVQNEYDLGSHQSGKNSLGKTYMIFHEQRLISWERAGEAVIEDITALKTLAERLEPKAQSSNVDEHQGNKGKGWRR